MDALNLWKLQLEQLLSEMAEQTRLEPGIIFCRRLLDIRNRR